MKAAIQRVPMPLSGVMLALAALGNLLQSASELLRLLCGGAAGVLLLLLVLKLILFRETVREDLKNPVMASTAATFPMGVMLLSVYVKPLIGGAAQALWFLALAIHAALIVYFTVSFIFKLDLKRVFASYFVLYVGITAAAITAPAYGRQDMGAAAVWFALICLTALLVLVTARYIRYPDVPEPARPLICIYTSPVNLCIVGYIQSVTPKSPGFLTALVAVSIALYIFALANAIRCLRLPFYPSYAALTFPFVISATASKQAAACLAGLGRPLSAAFSHVVLVQTVIAAALVVYVLVRFLAAILRDPARQAIPRAV